MRLLGPIISSPYRNRFLDCGQWILGMSSQAPYTYFSDSQYYSAINHVLTNSYLYQKPSESRFVLGRVVGPGLLVAEGEKLVTMIQMVSRI